MLLSIFLWTLGGIVAYCGLCWIIGFSLYLAGRVHPELALACTVCAPLMPIAVVGTWFNDKKYEFHVRGMQKVSRWVAENLRVKGIGVNAHFSDGYDAIYDRCKVLAEVKLEQVADYQNVYEAAIKKFRRLTPAQICGSATPPEPLDHAWAKRVGITEYFAEELCFPCVDCGAQKPWWELIWGDEASHAKLHLAEQVTEYTLRDGTKRIVHGHLCDVCTKKLDYSSSSSYFAKSS